MHFNILFLVSDKYLWISHGFIFRFLRWKKWQLILSQISQMWRRPYMKSLSTWSKVYKTSSVLNTSYFMKMKDLRSVISAVYSLTKKEYWQRRQEWLMWWRKTALDLSSKLRCCYVISLAVQSGKKRTINGSNLKKLDFFFLSWCKWCNTKETRGKGFVGSWLYRLVWRQVFPIRCYSLELLAFLLNIVNQTCSVQSFQTDKRFYKWEEQWPNG